MVCEGIKLNMFVGSRIGTFKHVRYDQSSKKKRKDITRQLQDVKSIQKGEGVSCMIFKDQEETEILLGKDNRIIQTYNLLHDQFTDSYNVDFGEGKLHSLSVYEDTIIGAVQSGVVKIWKSKSMKGFELNAGKDLERMKHCADDRNLIATGGKENDLKIWDLEKREAIFSGKNVPHDWLQLRVPIWISDICFLPDTGGNQVAIASRYGVVRLYDIRTQRRPVSSIEFQGQTNTCITPGFREKQVLVGTGRGILQMVDLRGPGKPDKAYKGSTGSVTSALCLPDKGVVVSVSLDRHLRIHQADSKELLHKQYMTTKLTTFLIRSPGKTPLPHDIIDGTEEIKNEEVKEEEDLDAEEKSDSEFEEIFNNMEVVGEEKFSNRKHKKRIDDKNKIKINKEKEIAGELVHVDDGDDVKKSKKRKLKQSTDGTPNGDSVKKVKKEKKKKKIETEDVIDEERDVVVEAPSLDESIKKLLKSTEKKKREFHKKKMEKKRRSVFNC